MRKYTMHFRTQTPQSMPITEQEKRMVRNRAGGFVFDVTDEVQAERFLILGTTQGCYYEKAPALTRENATNLDRLLEGGQGPWLVNKIAEISDQGRAPKNDPAIFALAMATKLGDLETRRLAAKVMPKVCRTATHVAMYAEALKVFSKITVSSGVEHYSWGPIVKRAFTNWLDALSDDALAYQLVKYRQREGWTLRDVLRRAKPVGADSATRDTLYGWATGKKLRRAALPSIIDSYERAQRATKADEIVKEIDQYNLPWEAIPSAFARDVRVQEALFQRMPLGATIRQLGRLSSLGLFPADSNAEKLAIDRITHPITLARARIHPMAIYIALEVYKSGQGMRGSLRWPVNQKIVKALDTAFMGSFKTVKPTGKNVIIGVDTSGSMRAGGVAGIPGFQCVEAAFMMAYIMARTEPNARTLMFNDDTKEFSFKQVESVEALGNQARKLFESFNGGTDVALPMLYAAKHIPDADAFVCLTDDETWAGRICHPVEANFRYREKTGRPTKLVSVGMIAHHYSVVPVDDAETLAVVGFDAAAPAIVADFLK